jgi:hypothetical protein
MSLFITVPTSGAKHKETTKRKIDPALLEPQINSMVRSVHFPHTFGFCGFPRISVATATEWLFGKWKWENERKEKEKTKQNKNLGTMAHTWNPATQEAETQWIIIWGDPQPYFKPRTVKKNE